MALKKKITKQIGYTTDSIEVAVASGEVSEIIKNVEFEDAYIMVASCSYKKENGVVCASANIYSAVTKIFLIETVNFDFKPDLTVKADNFVAQAYAELKKMGRFADATDC